MKSLRPFVFIVLAASFISSCKKGSIEDGAAVSEGGQLVKVLVTSGFGTVNNAFRYDNTDRLSAIDYGSNESDYKYTVDLDYRADGLLATSSEMQFNTRTNSSRATVSYAFSYDTANRTVRTTAVAAA
jgi:hypothetical protein